MFQDLVEHIAHGTNLRPSLHALRGAWEALPPAKRRRFKTLDRFAYAVWTERSGGAFAWHRRTEHLDQITHPFTVQLVYKSASDPALLSWELVGFTSALRQRLLTNLQTLENIGPDGRDHDLALLHREIITAFRIEEMGLHRQVEQVREFLEKCGCRILHVHGINDAHAELRRQAFKRYAVDDHRARLREIMEKLFALAPRILRHPAADPAVALRDTGADQFITFDPHRSPAFSLEPVLQAECNLYLHAGVLECNVADLERTVSAVIEVLEQRHWEQFPSSERATA